MMEFRESKLPEEAGPQLSPQGKRRGPPRWKKAEKEITALRLRMSEVEQEIQETRRLNKRLAEITDVVAEVLLPAEQRDEERLRTILSKYDSTM
jgi:hypothetical protein